MKHVAGSNSTTTLTEVKEGDVQPNAIDLRVDKIFRLQENVFTLSEHIKNHRGATEMAPDSGGWWQLMPGSYEVLMKNIIHVGKAEAGWVITRSTLNRNGVFLTSGLYDSGYNGVMAGVMHVMVAPFRIQRGTRIGQYISFDAEALHEYKGSYGLNSAHDKAKYSAPQEKSSAELQMEHTYKSGVFN